MQKQSSYARSMEARSALSVEFQKNNKIPDEAMTLVEKIADVAMICHRFQGMFPHLDNQLRRRMAETLYKVRETLDDNFPMSTGESSIAEACVLCIGKDAKDDRKCTHERQMQVALIFMAAFRISPKVDLDEEDDEMPDPDVGMVKT